jgi:hypothetical protein
VNINGNSGISWGGVISGSGLQPTLVFVDDYFVIASNIQQIEEFTADNLEEGSLVNSAGFQQVDRGLQEKNLSMAFLDFAKFAEMLKELASWGGTMIAIKDRDLARRSKIIIDRLINPLLDGLSMYSRIGTRAYAQDDYIIFESTTAIDHGKEYGKPH